MATNSADTDLRVREHFDGQMELYVDRHHAQHLSICAERIELLREALLLRDTRCLRLLDIGCGAGYLSDAFLREFPQSQAVAMDVSIGMLTRNQSDPRKLLLVADARAIPCDGGRFDVINFDTVLHHVIHPDGYRSTIHGIAGLLASLKGQLSADGSIMIREIYHEYRLWTSLACRVLHRLTCTQLPKPLAALLRLVGIHTANVGVCFLTRKQWQEVFQECGYVVVSQTDRRWRSPLRFLGFRANGEIYYFLRPAEHFHH